MPNNKKFNRMKISPQRNLVVLPGIMNNLCSKMQLLNKKDITASSNCSTINHLHGGSKKAKQLGPLICKSLH